MEALTAVLQEGRDVVRVDPDDALDAFVLQAVGDALRPFHESHRVRARPVQNLAEPVDAVAQKLHLEAQKLQVSCGSRVGWAREVER